MARRDLFSSNIGQLVEGFRETIQEARNSHLDLSEVYPPQDSLTYRIQGDLSLYCSRVMFEYVDRFGWGAKPDPELLEKILGFITEAAEMFGKFKPARDKFESGAAFIVQMTSAGFPDLVPQQYMHLMDYELPCGIFKNLKIV